MVNWHNDFMASSPLSSKPIVGMTRHGITFNNGGPRHRVTVLQVQPAYYDTGGRVMAPIDTGLSVVNNVYAGAGAPGLLQSTGEVGFKGRVSRYISRGAGVLDINGDSYTEFVGFSGAIANGDRLTREHGIYKFEQINKENGVKEQLIIDNLPPGLSGDRFVIETEHLDIFGTPPAPGDLTGGHILGDGTTINPGHAWDANGDEIQILIRVVDLPSPKKFKIYWGVPVDWLSSAAFPVTIDPTYSEQPDAAAGKDAQIDSNSATTNYGTTSGFDVGEKNAAPNNTRRTLIQFDLSAISSGSIISSGVLSIWQYGEFSDNTRTARVYRLLQAWTEAGATWNTYDGISNWGTAGANNTTTDREATEIGSRSFTATEAAGEKQFTLDGAGADYAELEAMCGSVPAFTNNGFLIKMDTEVDDKQDFRSSDYGTASERPKLVITYTIPQSSQKFII